MHSALPKSRLGRGLASLIGEPVQVGTRLPAEGEQRMVAIAQVKSSALNPRKDFREDELAELAESIRTKGLVQPIIVRPDPTTSGDFEIVAGERRWRAAQMAGLDERLRHEVGIGEELRRGHGTVLPLHDERRAAGDGIDRRDGAIPAEVLAGVGMLDRHLQFDLRQRREIP